MNDRKRILAGIRPTGPLHLGHYAGAIEIATMARVREALGLDTLR